MGDMADAAADDSAIEDDGYEDDDLDRWRGYASEWQSPSGKGPARFKIGNLKVQVWKFEYQSDDLSAAYVAARDFAENGTFVEATGQASENSFYSDKARREISTTQRTVYSIEEAEPEADEPVAVKEATKKAVSKGAPRGNAGGKATLSKEEWAEKDRQTSAAIRSAWAVQTAVSALVAGKGEPPTLEQIEIVAARLTEIADRLKESLLSGSVSATASLSPTPAEAPSSAPASEERAPSKASKKPAKTSKSD